MTVLRIAARAMSERMVDLRLVMQGSRLAASGLLFHLGRIKTATL